MWVTRKQIRTNRTATAWLIRRFIDPEAFLYFVEPEKVAEFQIKKGAIGFDAPGATYPHKDEKGRCSFEALVDQYFPDDMVLREIARIVRGADFPEEINLTPESAGLRAISQGFTLVEDDDLFILQNATFLYNALYASIKSRAENK
ncbi:MAG: chromate resistance protein (plasmid) [Candidatus Manganitrophus sp.]|nr:chromate resistance protein [Candidatus Manganitrophus sp.]MDC4228245.1 chromate resistance protein [Candidatus Manganitrophus sp.]WDT73498.1 MAG: chromate resistance protein [Candidatus Manganitrophus sp.]